MSDAANALAARLPRIPVDDDGPVFAEPWQAQVFAMTVKLHEGGAFSWTDWADHLGAELAAAGENDSAENYYLHWLAALEKLLDARKLVRTVDREKCKAAWDTAARATPHGRPIKLPDTP